MNLLLRLLLMLGLVSLVACSSGENENDDDFDEAEGVDLVEEDEDLEGSEIVLDEDEDLFEEGDSSNTASSDMSNHAPDASKGMAQYVVQKHDTLMWIAFKIYGDYGRWRDLVQSNAGRIDNGHITEGMTINYSPPMQEFVWNPEGDPYLIKRGENLGVVSTNVYGVKKRWKEIYNNNRPLIRNPNLIFAGFTIYYIPDNKVAAR